ncbi:hypothetical protein GGI11_002127 [Coemansia sp. RSA 2049]|nr:hypothetical protein GGI11_002127 [Coemansia sp. RSA 2049]
MGKRILYVTGFSRDTRARDLAHAFERYGRLVRCDIPGARRDAKPFAFVEYEDSRDADDAYDRMHDQYVDEYRISVQWAKRPPARSWRFDGGESSRRSSRNRSRSRSRSRSPYGGNSRRRGSRDRGHHGGGRHERRGSRDDSSRYDRNGGGRGRHRDDESRSRSRDRRSVDSLDRDSHRRRSVSPRDASPPPSNYRDDRRYERDAASDEDDDDAGARHRRPAGSEHGDADDLDADADATSSVGNGMNVDLDEPHSPAQNEHPADASPRDIDDNSEDIAAPESDRAD